MASMTNPAIAHAHTAGRAIYPGALAQASGELDLRARAYLSPLPGRGSGVNGAVVAQLEHLDQMLAARFRAVMASLPLLGVDANRDGARPQILRKPLAAAIPGGSREIALVRQYSTTCSQQC